MIRFLPTLLLLLLSCNALEAMGRFGRLKELDVTQPFCNSVANLDVANEYFVEIANPLPGREEYNAIIRLFRKKNWSDFDIARDQFRRVFENSPLIEAISFLESQAKFEQAETGAGPEALEADKWYKQTLLLYPKSTLVPILTGGAAAYWLKRELYQKAMGLYQKAQNEFPDHDLSCVYSMGIGEASFQLQDWDTAKAIFDKILKSCTSPRIQTGALLRNADMERDRTPKASFSTYESLIQSSGAIINHYYPAVLFNLGEIKYRNQQYPSSRFYFNEFLARRQNQDVCFPAALKRMADIAFQSELKKDQTPSNEVMGLYFAVKDQSPRSDYGHFSYLHGLLLELADSSKAEQERRLKLVDEEADKIIDENLRSQIYLEKGLAMLEVGEGTALAYLVRLNEKTSFNINKGEIGKFVRENLMKILEKEAEIADSKSALRGEAQNDAKVFSPIEAAYPVWLKGTSEEEKARLLYAKYAIHRFKDSLSGDQLSQGMEKLSRWKASELWPKNGLDKKRRLTLASPLVKLFQEKEGDELLEIAKLTWEKREVAKLFLEPEHSSLLVTVMRLCKETEALKLALKQNKGGRRPASLDSQIPSEEAMFLWRQQGLNYWAVKQYREADEAFKKVVKGDEVLAAKKDRLNLYFEEEKFSDFATLLFPTMKILDKDDQGHFSKLLVESVQRGKLWQVSDKLISLIKDYQIDGATAGSIYYVAGRGQYERNQCRSAVKSFDLAFSLAAQSSLLTESKFRYAKCQLKEKKIPLARKAWQEVLASKDSFWSPLAQNELRLLEGK